MLYLGALRAGLIAVPVNPAYTRTEVDSIRADCDTVLHVHPQTVRTNCSRGCRTVPIPRADRGGEEI